MGQLQDVAGVLGVTGKAVRGLSPLRLIAMIEEGLPVAALDRVSHAVAPTDGAFKFQIVSRATLARRKRESERLSAEESGRLARVAKVWALACEVWGGEDEARAFLFRPHAMLEGRRPIDMVLGTEFGAQIVEDILGRLKYGSAA